ILQSITRGGQACAFGVVDIRRQFPERDGLGRGEAFSNLHRRQAGLQQETLAIRRRCPRRVKSGLFEPPVARLEGCAFRLDAVAEVTGSVEPENAHAAQFDALLAARLGVDDRLAVLAALAYPESASGAAEAAVAAGHIGFKMRRMLAQVCRDRI